MIQNTKEEMVKQQKMLRQQVVFVVRLPEIGAGCVTSELMKTNAYQNYSSQEMFKLALVLNLQIKFVTLLKCC